MLFLNAVRVEKLTVDGSASTVNTVTCDLMCLVSADVDSGYLAVFTSVTDKYGLEALSSERDR